MQFVNIEIPENLSDIKLSTYKKFILLANEENGDEQALYHFCGLTPAQQEGMKKIDLDDIKEQVGNVLNERPALTKTFKFKGKEYGFHPKLEDISMGEYVDLDEYLKEPYKNAEKVLGVLYRPITSKSLGRYLIEDYNPDIHNGMGFQDLSADIFLGCLLFFYRLEINSLKTFLLSSQNPQKNQHLISRLNSLESGVGTEQLTRLLEIISSDLMK